MIRKTKKKRSKNMSKTQIRKKKRKKKRVEIWATQIETNRLRTTSKNPARNSERGRNPPPKHKPKMQTKPKTQPEIHAETQTQTPKPIPKHKHSPKYTLKYKHKHWNPYRNRNTNAEMGQRWRLGAWVSDELRKKDGWSFAGERHTQIEQCGGTTKAPPRQGWQDAREKLGNGSERRGFSFCTGLGSLLLFP